MLWYNLFIADEVHGLEGHKCISKGAPDHNYKKYPLIIARTDSLLSSGEESLKHTLLHFPLSWFSLSFGILFGQPDSSVKIAPFCSLRLLLSQLSLTLREKSNKHTAMEQAEHRHVQSIFACSSSQSHRPLHVAATM